MAEQHFSRRSRYTDSKEEAEPVSRTKAREEQKNSLEQDKIKRLKRRLNYVIAALIVMLLFVLLFMRFINF